jgi:hypothetical protein
VRWKSLVELGQAESQDEPALLHAPPNRSKSPWIRPTAAAALLLLGLYVAWAVVLRVKTVRPKNGDADDHARRLDVAKSNTPPAVADVPKPEAKRAVSRSPGESRASVLQGDWAIEGEELVQSKKEFGDELLFTDSNWPEYDLTLEAKYEDSPRAPGPEYMTRPGCGVLLHRQGPDCFCRLGWDVHGYGMQYMVNGMNLPIWKNAPTVFKPGDWHSLRLEVRQKSIKCFIDQNIMFSDSNPPLNRGSVGLTSRFTVARFRRIRATDPGGRVLFEGPPTLDRMPAMGRGASR